MPKAREVAGGLSQPVTLYDDANGDPLGTAANPVQSADAQVRAAAGQTTDAEATGDGSIVALLKRLRTLLSGGLPSALTASGNLKVAVVEPLADGSNTLGYVYIQRLAAYTQVTINSGQTTSGDVVVPLYAAFGLVMPAAFTGTSITFEVSHDGTTYQPLYDRFNTQVSMTVAAGRSYDLPAELNVWSRWRIVSSAAEAAARTLTIVVKT